MNMKDNKKTYIRIQLPDNDELIQWLLKHCKEPEYKRYYYSNYFLYSLNDYFNLKIFYLTSEVAISKIKGGYVIVTADETKRFSSEEYKENVARPAALWITRSESTNKFFIHASEQMILRLNLIVKKKFGISLFNNDKDTDKVVKLLQDCLKEIK